MLTQPDLAFNSLAGAHLLVRERGSGTRTTAERLFKQAGVPLRIGAEMSSNEAIKQMCAAGFGIAFLSLHTCVLELDAGLLKVLPIAGNPVERDWYVMHLASRVVPQVASAFETFLCEQAQAQIQRQLGHVGKAPAKRTTRSTARRASGQRSPKPGSA